MTPDLEEARRFLALLTGDAAEPMTWQTFDDGPNKRPELAGHRHGTLDACAGWLAAQNARGCGIFVTVNETDGKGRKASNIVRVRSLFVDCDDGVGRVWQPDPSIVVQSRNGEHAYWNTDDVPLETFLAAQTRLIRRWNTDKSVKDLPRVMRVPGFWHMKNPAEPFMVRVVSGDGRLYAWDVLFPPEPVAPPKAKPAKIPATDVPGDYTSLDICSMFGTLGLYGYSMGGGKHAVRCPWDSSHSHPAGADSYDTSTVIWETTGDKWPGFLCSHSHCSGRTTQDVIDFAGRSVVDAHCSRPSKVSKKRKTLPAPPVDDEVPPPTDEDAPLPLDAPEDAPLPGILFPHTIGKGKSRRPAPDHCENTAALLAHYDVRVRYNTMRHAPETQIDGIPSAMETREGFALAWVENRAAEHRLSRRAIASHVEELRNGNHYHPVRDWMLSAPWDGRSRLEDLKATLALSLQQSPALAWLLLRKWLIYCVKAWDEKKWPEVQGQGVLVLQGPQGIEKTRWLAALLPLERGWSSMGRVIRPEDRDSVQQACAYALTEWGELDGTFRKSDVALIKAFVTQPFDTYRVAYGRTWAQFRRSTAFCASVNEAEFLADPTGSRRFWPLSVLGCMADHQIDTQQLFAEMHTYASAGEAHWLSAEEQLFLEGGNEKHHPPSPLEMYVNETWTPCPSGRHVSLTEICEAIPKFRNGQVLPTAAEVSIISRALRSMGAEPSRTKKSRGYLVERVSGATGDGEGLPWNWKEA